MKKRGDGKGQRVVVEGDEQELERREKRERKRREGDRTREGEMK